MTIFSSIRNILFAGPALCVLTAGAQPTAGDGPGKKYTVYNRTLTEVPPAGSLHLDAKPGAGVAWINDEPFVSGTLELDIRGRDLPQQSFVGFAFHGAQDTVYEAIYFRPFNFRSTDPVRKTHAVQYVSEPDNDWPKLRSQFPNKYEQPISPAPDPNQWFHVRIDVSGDTIKVYVNGNTQPSLVVLSLDKTRGKKMGYWVGNDSEGDWKNLKITRPER